MSKTSPVNFRVFLVVAVTTVAVIMCVYLFAVSKVLGIVFGCVLLAALLILAAIVAIMFYRGKIKLRYLIAAVLSFCIGLSAFTVGAVTVDKWNKSAEIVGFRTVVGRVECVDVRTGNYRIDLGKLQIDGKRVSGMLRLTIAKSDNNIGDYARCGDIFRFNANISSANILSGNRINGTAYRTNIRYYARVRSSDIEVEIGKPTVIENLLTSWRKLLTENMGDRYGNIAFSMVTGDKHALDSDVTDVFSAAGIGHIVAVSGLHIGFMALLLSFLLTRTDKRIKFSVTSAALILYCIIADFSPSVVRATIMAEISMLAVFFGGRRDIMSSLCCAFCLILAVKPLYLYEAGFLLSFGSIFGIALFAGSIARFLKKRGAAQKVADAIGSSVSVQIGATPAMIYIFNKISVFSLIVNVVLIPYISVVFIGIIVFSLIGAIPYLGVVLKAIEYLLMPIDYIATGIAAIPYSVIYVSATGAVFLCYPVMFFASGFFMMPRGKIAVVLASIVACLSFCLVSVSKSVDTTPDDLIETKSVVIADDYDVIPFYNYDCTTDFRLNERLRS